MDNLWIATELFYPEQTSTSVTIGGLTPATEYYIRVSTTTNASTCYSVTISASTL